METTIEEIFELQPGMGGLHNLLNLHRVFTNEAGDFSLELHVTDNLLNPKGIVHGGTLFALCDSTVGTYIASQNDWAVTVDSTIQFYRPALSGDTLISTLKERKHGRNISVFQVEVVNSQGKHIVDATFTMYYTLTTQ